MTATGRSNSQFNFKETKLKEQRLLRVKAALFTKKNKSNTIPCNYANYINGIMAPKVDFRRSKLEPLTIDFSRNRDLDANFLANGLFGVQITNFGKVAES